MVLFFLLVFIILFALGPLVLDQVKNNKDSTLARAWQELKDLRRPKE